MLAGMIVIIALFNLQIITLHQTTRVFTKVDATQHARVAIEDLENELHRRASSTTSPRFRPAAPPTSLHVHQPGGERSDADAVSSINGRSSTPVSRDADRQSVRGDGHDHELIGVPVYTFSDSAEQHADGADQCHPERNHPGLPVLRLPGADVQWLSPYTDASGNPYEMLLDGTSEVPGTSTIPTAQPLSTSPSLSSTNASNTAEVVTTVSVGAVGHDGREHDRSRTPATPFRTASCCVSPLLPTTPATATSSCHANDTRTADAGSYGPHPAGVSPARTGFTMMIALGVLVVTSAAGGCDVRRDHGRRPHLQHDLDGKRAYSAARGGSERVPLPAQPEPELLAELLERHPGADAGPGTTSPAEYYSYAADPGERQHELHRATRSRR